MAKLSREDVLKLARLARLQLSEAEVEKYQTEISTLLEYMELLNTVDLKGLEPTKQVTGLVNVMRADQEIDYTAQPDDLLKNAPATEDGHIKVKRMLA